MASIICESIFSYRSAIEIQYIFDDRRYYNSRETTIRIREDSDAP
jgi:hypothetical protein